MAIVVRCCRRCRHCTVGAHRRYAAVVICCCGAFAAVLGRGRDGRAAVAGRESQRLHSLGAFALRTSGLQHWASSFRRLLISSVLHKCSTPLIVQFLQLLFLLILPRVLGSCCTYSGYRSARSASAGKSYRHPWLDPSIRNVQSTVFNRARFVYSQCSIGLDPYTHSVQSISIHAVTTSNRNRSRSIHSQCSIDLDPCIHSVRSTSQFLFSMPDVSDSISRLTAKPIDTYIFFSACLVLAW